MQDKKREPEGVVMHVQAMVVNDDIPLDDGWRMLMVRNVTAERQDAADVRILKIRVL